MVKKVTFLGFRGSDRTNRPPPLDPPLVADRGSKAIVFFVIQLCA